MCMNGIEGMCGSQNVQKIVVWEGVCVCVCVCAWVGVCVCERERERERAVSMV